jgi:long-chain acyl-CoA synthetase
MSAMSDPAPSRSRPWLERYDADVPPKLDYTGLRLHELLRRAARRYPDTAALVSDGRATSYAALDDEVDRAAAGLRHLGLACGERVGLCMSNRSELVVAFQAAWRAGYIAVPMNPLAAGLELARQLEDSGAAAMLTTAGPWARLQDAGLPAALRHVVLADIDDVNHGLETLGTRAGAVGDRASRLPTSPPRVSSFRRLAAMTAPVRLPPAGIDEAVLLYTGGTTGLPKAAVLTHRNLVANAMQLAAWAPRLDDGAEVMLSALPLVHGYAMTACMNAAILRGWTQVLVPDPRDTDHLLLEIERSKVTVFPGVPTLYGDICAHPDALSGRRDLHSIEACISGAAPLPIGVQSAFQQLTGGRLVEGYGLTEASPATHCNALAAEVRTGGIGVPLPDTDCRLVDVETETRDVEPGQPGVLCVSGPQVMAGYWQRPDETADVLRPDDGTLWLHTGDIAEMSEDGLFTIIDRKKEVIIASGGLKVYPSEIEGVLSTHPKVRLSAVVGVPVGPTDQRAKAFVVLRPGQEADAGEILHYLSRRLASYKVPKAIEFRAELPLAFTGKVLKRLLVDVEPRSAAGGPAGLAFAAASRQSECSARGAL